MQRKVLLCLREAFKLALDCSSNTGLMVLIRGIGVIKKKEENNILKKKRGKKSMASECFSPPPPPAPQNIRREGGGEMREAELCTLSPRGRARIKVTTRIKWGKIGKNCCPPPPQKNYFIVYEVKRK